MSSGSTSSALQVSASSNSISQNSAFMAPALMEAETDPASSGGDSFIPRPRRIRDADGGSATNSSAPSEAAADSMEELGVFFGPAGRGNAVARRSQSPYQDSINRPSPLQPLENDQEPELPPRPPSRALPAIIQSAANSPVSSRRPSVAPPSDQWLGQRRQSPLQTDLFAVSLSASPQREGSQQHDHDGPSSELSKSTATLPTLHTLQLRALKNHLTTALLLFSLVLLLEHQPPSAVLLRRQQ